MIGEQQILFEIVRQTGRAIIAFVKSEPRVAAGQKVDHLEAVGRSISNALKWGFTLQVFGMSKPRDPRVDAVPLRLAEQQRKFRGRDSQEVVDEQYLDRTSCPLVLLGDPGSGKTTTLKRLVQRLVLEEDSEAAVAGALPIVIPLRELASDESLIPRIAEAIGFQVEFRESSISSKSELAIGSKPSRRADSDLWIGQMRARSVIAKFLSTNRAVVIVDGLDEARCDGASLTRELVWLSRNAAASQIIVSCRTGDFHGALEGFEVLEICPLSESEIREICSKYTTDPSAFLAALTVKPYRDLADRPLFLVYLLLIFARYKYLPPQPVDVYRMIVLLILKEWDAQRDISRLSRYANFTHERKLGFLAALSYELTFRIRLKSFSHKQLVRAYKAINSRFDLPDDDESAAEVVSEIESHTGLIVAAGPLLYEFSHLSLQEYLAADYMSREAYSQHLNDYLETAPGPVAISIALASDPGISFAAVFLGLVSLTYRRSPVSYEDFYKRGRASGLKPRSE